MTEPTESEHVTGRQPAMDSPPGRGPGRLVYAELQHFARTRSGEYIHRYREILREAFARHTTLLNAKQLRELAGGGSQTTAQRAIEEFRSEIGAALSRRIRLGADVPEELNSAASSLLEQIWAQARELATQAWAQERSSLTRERDLAAQDAQQAHAESDRLRQDVVVRDERIAAAEARVQALEQQVTALDASLSRQRSATQDAHLALAAERQEFERKLGDAARKLAEVERALVAHRADAAARFDRMLLEHREALSGVQRSLGAQLGRAQQEIGSLRGRVDEVVAREAKAQIEGARMAQALRQAEELSAQAQQRQAAAQAEAQSVREALLQLLQRDAVAAQSASSDSPAAAAVAAEGADKPPTDASARQPSPAENNQPGGGAALRRGRPRGP